jgi:hypothetical protein
MYMYIQNTGSVGRLFAWRLLSVQKRFVTYTSAFETAVHGRSSTGKRIIIIIIIIIIAY